MCVCIYTCTYTYTYIMYTMRDPNPKDKSLIRKDTSTYMAFPALLSY